MESGRDEQLRKIKELEQAAEMRSYEKDCDNKHAEQGKIEEEQTEK